MALLPLHLTTNLAQDVCRRPPTSKYVAQELSTMKIFIDIQSEATCILHKYFIHTLTPSKGRFYSSNVIKCTRENDSSYRSKYTSSEPTYKHTLICKQIIFHYTSKLNLIFWPNKEKYSMQGGKNSQFVGTC